MRQIHRRIMIYSGSPTLTGLQKAIDRHYMTQRILPEIIHVSEREYPTFESILPVRRTLKFKGIRILPI